MDRYRSDGPSSLKRYGQRLNRCSGVRPVSLANKGNHRIVSREEDLTRAIGGVSSVYSPPDCFPTKNAPPQGVSRARMPPHTFIPPEAAKAEGLLKGVLAKRFTGSLFFRRCNTHVQL